MTPDKFKVLTYGPVFVNAAMLHQGIYSARIPCMFIDGTSMDSVKHNTEIALGNGPYTGTYLENLGKCSLSTCAIVTAETTTYLMDIDGEATVVLARSISEAMDKAAAVAKKEYKMVNSKSLPLLF